MNAIDRAALIEQAALPIFRDIVRCQGYDPDSPEEMSDWSESDLSYMQTDARTHATLALPVIIKALLAPLRELHYAAYQDANRNPICPDCHGKAGTHPCGCWAKYDTVPVCGVCWEGWKYIAVEWPCPTVRLLDAIEAEVQP